MGGNIRVKFSSRCEIIEMPLFYSRQPFGTFGKINPRHPTRQALLAQILVQSNDGIGLFLCALTW